VLRSLARQQPLLLVIDDLQWADPGSLSLMFHLGRRLRGQRILLIGIYRPADVTLGRDGERHPLELVVNEFRRNFGQIQVDLSQTEGRAFVKALLDSEPHRLGTSFQEALYNHARGHALFTVEMLRDMQARGDLVQDEQGRWIEGETLDWQTLPARVEGVIGERIGRLPVSSQEILKVASVEGELFTAEVVARVRGLDEAKVVRQLSGSLDKQHRLVRNQSSRLLAVAGQRLSQYRFRHILFQRYLYHSLDEAERVYLHQAVGQALEQLYKGQLEEVAVEPARHFQMAGLVAEAVAYLQQAGDRAVRLSAYQEAIAHYSRALELLESLPDPVRYAQQELNLQLALGRAQIVAKGSAAPEVERAFSRARELGQQLEDNRLLLDALGGLMTYYAIQGDILQAYELAEQMLQLAQDLEDPSLIIGAHIAMGVALLYRGELAQAQTHFEQAFALYQPQQSADLISGVGQGLDSGILAQRLLALIKWLQGYPEQALVLLHQALTMAEELDHPFSIAGVLGITCEIHYYRREVQATKAWAEKLLNLTTKHGFVLWKTAGTMYRGWALTEKGREKEGIEQIRQGLKANTATGARSCAVGLTLLVDAHLRLGQVAEGLAILDEVLTAVEQAGERYPDVELYRLKGELLSRRGANDGEIEQQFLKALEIARRQGAKSWELRATVSLCRLWQAQGKKEEARQMLADIYGWFTEGFDTVDLKEAQALLEELT
jgi:adenylate cyclase